MEHKSHINYQALLDALKDKIRQARLRVNYSVNTELLKIYWEVGKTISDQENQEGWGKKVVDTLSKDLRSEFKDMKGLSPRNLRYMRDFAEAYPNFPFLQAAPAKSIEIERDKIDQSILQAPLAKLSWYHHITLLDKIKEPEERVFYIYKAIEMGWSRDVMVHQIEGGLHKRQGQLPTNFKTTISSDQSELVQQIFKDPYKFDFIYLGQEAKERDLEDALTTQITNFLLELGQWFAFMGRQHRITLGDKEYFYDLLFYHTRLKRYIVIDLKIGEFQPEHLGKMEFYLKLADEQLKDAADEKSIGLILCKTKDGLVAEYALRDSQQPIGIAAYKINESLPEHIKGELPSIEEIEQRIELEMEDLKSPVQKRMEQLKLKLTALKTQEVKTSATTAILFRIIDNGVKPLFVRLLDKLEQLQSDFISQSMYWFAEDKKVQNLEEFEKAWKNEALLRKYKDLSFTYRLHGLKMGGTETFDTGIELHFLMDTYWYGFRLVNYYNQQPIIKKLYDQDLTIEEIELITDASCEKIIEDIERQIERINKL